MNRLLGFWLAVLLIFSGLTLAWFGNRYMKSNASGSTSTEEVSVEFKGDPLTEFELIDQTGRRFNSNELKGQVWAGSFFFANCPKTCYQQNIRLQQLQVKFAERGLQMVSITCDPVNDTPVALSRYAGLFNADPENWRFLTPSDADMRYVQRIGNDFFNLMVDSSTHSDRVLVFDREGTMRGGFSVLKGDQLADLENLLDEVLSESSVTESREGEANTGDSDETMDSTDGSTTAESTDGTT